MEAYYPAVPRQGSKNCRSKEQDYCVITHTRSTINIKKELGLKNVLLRFYAIEKIKINADER
jgi:hypothetical protein